MRSIIFKKWIEPGVPTALALILVSCATSQSYLQPGIQSKEQEILVKAYCWEPGRDLDSFTDEEISAEFKREIEVLRGDGERSELYASRLIWMLAAAGDARFAELLARERKSTRWSVLHWIDGVWIYHGLDYPKTRGLYAKLIKEKN